MMIAGDRCTRACGFCAVDTAKPFPLEQDEPERVAEAVRRMNLKHVVITAVARDDIPDGGAEHFARTIQAIREMDSSIIIEILTPDFNGKDSSLQTVVEAAPHIFNHNLETVERLTPMTFPGKVPPLARFPEACQESGRLPRPEDGHQERHHARLGRGGERDLPGYG